MKLLFKLFPVVLASIFVLPASGQDMSNDENTLQFVGTKDNVVNEYLISLNGCDFRRVVGSVHERSLYDISKTSSGQYYVWNITLDSENPVHFAIPKDMSSKMRAWVFGGSKFVLKHISHAGEGDGGGRIYEVADVSAGSNEDALLFNDDGNYVGRESSIRGRRWIADLRKAKIFYSTCTLN